MSFLGGLFTGTNPTLSANIGKMGQEGDFDTSLGQTDVGNASTWYNDILSGDPTKTATALAPEISSIQNQTQQGKNQLAQFGGRSGGTAGAASAMDDQARGQITQLEGSLQGTAASNLSSIGQNEQGMALTAQQAQDSAAVEQQQLQGNSILGGLIKGAVGAAADYATGGLSGALGGMGGGGGANAPMSEADYQGGTGGYYE